jgi:hypothetical protein
METAKGFPQKGAVIRKVISIIGRKQVGLLPNTAFYTNSICVWEWRPPLRLNFSQPFGCHFLSFCTVAPLVRSQRERDRRKPFAVGVPFPPEAPPLTQEVLLNPMSETLNPQPASMRIDANDFLYRRPI